MTSEIMSNADISAVAEEMATFIAEEKVRAQNRLRTYAKVADKIPVFSIDMVDEKKALNQLQLNAEEELTTLMHLEKLLQVREKAAVQRRAQILAQNAQRNDGADDHEGEGFFMGGARNSPDRDLEDNFDPFSVPHGDDDKEIEPIKEDVEENSEESENSEEHDTINVIPNFKIRRPTGDCEEDMARSLPMSIPVDPDKARVARSPSPDEVVHNEGRDVHKMITAISKSMCLDPVMDPSSPDRKHAGWDD